MTVSEVTPDPLIICGKQIVPLVTADTVSPPPDIVSAVPPLTVCNADTV